MIKKIFYSLVLFGNINYDTVINGFIIYDISEVKLGEFKITFINGHLLEEIIFIHKDFFLGIHNIRTKNWFIFGKNISLLNTIFNIIYLSDTGDFNFFKDKSFYDKIPFGTVLTITSKCNLFCNYCFNDYDYPLKDRNNRLSIGLDKYKEIVDILYNSGTRDIIITGGEPFSSPFLFDLLDYIKSKKIFIRINTNGTLLSNNILNKLNKNFSLNLMVSMHEFNNNDYYEINRIGAKNISGIDGLNSFKNKFEKKVIQLKMIKKFKNISLDFLTILTPKNILYLDDIYKFVLSNFDIENWHFFRLYSTGTTKGISRELINLAIHKIYKLNNIFGVDFKIVDSVPFCVTKNLEIASKVVDGELSINHNVKTIITTDGNIQIMSAFDSNLGIIFEKDLLKVWNGDFVQKMLNHGFLPNECFDCKYKDDCRGGSRMDANIFNGSYSAFDPLGDLNNKVKI